MPLESIARPVQRLRDNAGSVAVAPLADLTGSGQENRFRKPLAPRRISAVWIVIALTILLALTACAEGTAHDAARGQQVDARRTSVVQSVQETYTANIIDATPPATATKAP